MKLPFNIKYFHQDKWLFSVERIVGKPILASLLVGSSIIGFNALALTYFRNVNYYSQLIFDWQVHPLLFFSQVGPPFLIPFFIASVARITREKINEYNYMEDAIPAMFLTRIPKSKIHLINHQIPTKVNQSYHWYFPANQPNSNPETLLPKRFWKNTDQRKSFFGELTQNKRVHGRVFSFLSEENHEWQGLIYTRCKELEKDIKVQGMVIKLDTAN